MATIKYPSEESLTLALKLLNHYQANYDQKMLSEDNFLTESIYEFFDELKVYLVSLSS